MTDRFQKLREANQRNNATINKIMEKARKCMTGAYLSEDYQDLEESIRNALITAYTEGTMHNETWK